MVILRILVVVEKLEDPQFQIWPGVANCSVLAGAVLQLVLGGH